MSEDYSTGSPSEDSKDTDTQQQKALSGASIPAGLEFLYAACRQVYPNQNNPLQVTAVLKYWLGGPDPLDYISMYFNIGDPSQQIPPHWHYVSFGLSDLHGDGRVHEVAEPNSPSGFGFELTMRVKCENGEKAPPTWPATLMQSLAKYVFQTDSTLCSGDHVSWHCALDNSDSPIQHMLICEDPQLHVQNTPFGRVQFVQVVGITKEELQASQRWNGCGILSIMKRFPECGGSWHITDMRREKSIFDLDPSFAREVEKGIEEEGSNLSGVSAKICWTSHMNDEVFKKNEIFEVLNISQDANYTPISQSLSKEKQSAFTPVLSKTFNPSEISGRHQSFDCGIANRDCSSEKNEFFLVQTLPSLHITINLESGLLLPLALRGRLKHGRHFTFKSPLTLNALTLLTPSVEGAFVSPVTPYAVKGPWLQVLIEEELLDRMSADLASLTNPHQIRVPISYEWPNKKLKITVISDDIN